MKCTIENCLLAGPLSGDQQTPALARGRYDACFGMVGYMIEIMFEAIIDVRLALCKDNRPANCNMQKLHHTYPILLWKGHCTPKNV